MTKMDKWWAESPFERRPAMPARVAEHVPEDLAFQRYANDANLGKATSDLMRLSPTFYQRFGSDDPTLRAHVADALEGVWEYLVDRAPYRPAPANADIWRALDALDAATERPTLCESI